MPDVQQEEPREFAALFGGAPGDGGLPGLAAWGAREGYAMVPIRPGEKTPLCLLTDAAAKKADVAAKLAAQDAGRRNWQQVRHPCGIAHSTTDDKRVRAGFKRLGEKFDEPLNIAVDVYASRVFVVDADTAAEMASFKGRWVDAEQDREIEARKPTVLSPGARGVDGEWKHSEGGHFWFLLPEGYELGDTSGVTSMPIGRDPDHPAQLKITGYVLVPPSVRPEGRYVMGSDAMPAPQWLLDEVDAFLTGRRATRELRHDRAREADENVTLAQAAIEWGPLLTDQGWEQWHKVDGCGCEIWTAPGEHANPKSATAHDPGCGLRDTADGALHVWTDNLPDGLSEAGTKDFSKIQFVAWSKYGGSSKEAMQELDIDRHRADEDDDEEEDEGEQDYLAELAKGNEAKPDEHTQAILAKLIDSSEIHQIPQAVPLIDGLLDCKSVARMVGSPGSGKSFLALDWAIHIALGLPWQGREVTQGNVIYMAAEGLAGLRKRVAAWEAYYDRKIIGLKFYPEAVQILGDQWKYFVRAMVVKKPILTIVDTQARVTAGANENGPEEMGRMIKRVDDLKKYAETCALLVHHKGHTGDHGRGHSSVIAAVDSETDVSKSGPDITLKCSKQKDQEEFEPIHLQLVPVDLPAEKKPGAVLVAKGEPETPFDKPRVDENSSPRDRAAKWLHWVSVGGNGRTRAEVGRVVQEKDRCAKTGKPMTRATFHKMWSQLERDQVLDAVDKTHFLLQQREVDRLGL